MLLLRSKVGLPKMKERALPTRMTSPVSGSRRSVASLGCSWKASEREAKQRVPLKIECLVLMEGHAQLAGELFFGASLASGGFESNTLIAS